MGEVLQEELLVGLQFRYTLNNEHGLRDTWDHIQTQVTIALFVLILNYVQLLSPNLHKNIFYYSV